MEPRIPRGRPAVAGVPRPEAGGLGRLGREGPDEGVRELVKRMVTLCEEQPDVEFESVHKQGLLHPSPPVRMSSLAGLDESDDRSLIRPLCRMMMNDSSPAVRATAAESLAHLSALAQAGKLASKDKKSISDVLFRVLDNVNELDAVKLKALEAVSAFGGDRLTSYLALAWSSGDLSARQSSNLSNWPQRDDARSLGFSTTPRMHPNSPICCGSL